MIIDTELQFVGTKGYTKKDGTSGVLYMLCGKDARIQEVAIPGQEMVCPGPVVAELEVFRWYNKATGRYEQAWKVLRIKER